VAAQGSGCLYKKRNQTADKYISISNATEILTYNDPQSQYIFKESLDSLGNEHISSWKPTLLMHAIGYSLQELADSEKVPSAPSASGMQESVQCKRKLKDYSNEISIPPPLWR